MNNGTAYLPTYLSSPYNRPLNKMQAIQSVLSVVDRHQSQLANWADKPNIDYEAFVTISTWVQTGFEVWLL